MNKTLLLFMHILIHVTMASSLCSQQLQGRSFFSPRSQSTNLAREMSGWYPHIYQYGMGTNYGSIVINPAYAHSVRPARIAEFLFGTDTLAISGSTIENRGPEDILADYFGLSPQFASVINITPKIKNLMVNLDGYWGLDKYCKGLYVRIHAPLVWTRWDVQMWEDIELTGQNIPFAPLYMDEDAVPAATNTFLDVLNGSIRFGQMQEALAYGKVNGAQTKTGISDVQCTLGWNFILEERGHFGLSLRAAVPTGTKPESRFLFEPLVGNGHHWELGVGLSALSLLWEKDGDQALSFCVELNMMYSFASKQKRSFDLLPNGFGSRYMLVKEFDENGNYTGKLSPLINHTTLDCKVHIDLQCDILFMFSYTYNGVVFDIGYNGWIRSREKIALDGCIPKNRFALKGIQNVFFNTGQLSDITQSTATLHGNNLSESNQILVADAAPPVFINTEDLNLHSAGAWRMLTHKIFAYLGYSWFESTLRYKPFIGIGGEIEFEGENERNSVQVDKPTMSQLGLWLKVGFDC